MRRLLLPLLLVSALPLLASCTALQEIANLRNVDFAIDGVTQTNLAGVDVQDVRGYDDLGPLEVARVGATLATGRMPLSFTLNLGATNPETNSVNARLVQLDWTLLLDNTETISGIFNDERVIPPGSDVLIPISMELDLIDFFGSNLPDIVNLVGAITGQGSSEIALRARPTVTTPIGPITYPSQITIVSQQIGE
ncbi:MAG: hypothetical protein AAGI91_09205 [Bacteroidota bacterium]